MDKWTETYSTQIHVHIVRYVGLGPTKKNPQKAIKDLKSIIYTY